MSVEYACDVALSPSCRKRAPGVVSIQFGCAKHPPGWVVRPVRRADGSVDQQHACPACAPLAVAAAQKGR